MFNDSNYVNAMRNKQIAEFDRQQAKKQFTAKYKGQIEQGLTKDAFQTKYACTEQDLQFFDELEQEVKQDKIEEEQFLKGFNSKPLPSYNRTAPQGQQSKESEV
jgi:hypothetical protein